MSEKMKDEYLKLQKLSCRLLKFGGMGIDINAIVVYIYAIFLSVLTICFLILAVLEVMWNYKGLDTLTNTMETICLNWAFLFRVIVYIFNFHKIQNLLVSIDNDLWPIDKFGEELRDRIQGIIDIEVKWIKRICSFVIFSITVSLVKPLFVYPRMLPLLCYSIVDIGDTLNYCLMYLWQIFMMYIQIILLLGWNAMFISFSTYLVTQFSMLKHAFRTLSSEEDEVKCYENLKEYVDYHNKLLEILNEVKNVFYVQLFLQVVTLTVSICIQLYLLSAADFSDIPNFTKTISYTSDYLLELFLFCFAGSLITNACEIADATYNNGWEGKSHRFKIATRMIILQSQVPQVLKGGIYEINLNGYTNFVSMAFSVYTLLKSFREKNF